MQEGEWEIICLLKTKNNSIDKRQQIAVYPESGQSEQNFQFQMV